MDINKTPIHVNNVIVDLKIISKIKKGQKLNTNTKTIVDSSSWLGSFNRKFNSESRVLLLLYLNNILSEIWSIILNTKDKDIINNICNNLVLAKDGMNNLLETYKDDIGVNCKLSVILDDIDKILNHDFF